MTLDKAIKIVQETYKAAQKLDYIRNPLAFALYKAWKLADAEQTKGESR